MAALSCLYGTEQKSPQFSPTIAKSSTQSRLRTIIARNNKSKNTDIFLINLGMKGLIDDVEATFG